MSERDLMREAMYELLSDYRKTIWAQLRDKYLHSHAPISLDILVEETKEYEEAFWEELEKDHIATMEEWQRYRPVIAADVRVSLTYAVIETLRDYELFGVVANEADVPSEFDRIMKELSAVLALYIDDRLS